MFSRTASVTLFLPHIRASDVVTKALTLNGICTITHTPFYGKLTGAAANSEIVECCGQLVLHRWLRVQRPFKSEAPLLMEIFQQVFKGASATDLAKAAAPVLPQQHPGQSRKAVVRPKGNTRCQSYVCRGSAMHVPFGHSSSSAPSWLPGQGSCGQKHTAMISRSSATNFAQWSHKAIFLAFQTTCTNYVSV